MVFGGNGLSVGIGSADRIIDLSMLNGAGTPLVATSPNSKGWRGEKISVTVESNTVRGSVNGDGCLGEPWLNLIEGRKTEREQNWSNEVAIRTGNEKLGYTQGQRRKEMNVDWIGQELVRFGCIRL